jgi:hypothetical protein
MVYVVGDLRIEVDSLAVLALYLAGSGVLFRMR